MSAANSKQRPLPSVLKSFVASKNQQSDRVWGLKREPMRTSPNHLMRQSYSGRLRAELPLGRVRLEAEKSALCRLLL